MAYETKPGVDGNSAEPEPGRGVTHVEVTVDDAGTRQDTPESYGISCAWRSPDDGAAIGANAVPISVARGENNREDRPAHFGIAFPSDRHANHSTACPQRSYPGPREIEVSGDGELPGSPWRLPSGDDAYAQKA